MPWRRPEYFAEPYYGISGWVGRLELTDSRPSFVDGEILVRLHEGQHPSVICKSLPTSKAILTISLSWTNDGPRATKCQLQYVEHVGMLPTDDIPPIDVPLDFIRIVVSREDFPDDLLPLPTGG